jgi:predicted nicotinamide N-methyase
MVPLLAPRRARGAASYAPWVPAQPADLVEETLVLGSGRPLRVLRPRDSEELLREEAFEHEELLPYWAELWPSSLALARAVGARSLRGARTLELGCGLGVVSIAAALAGGRVLATDWSAEAVRFTADNAERNGVQVDTAVVDWSAPEEIVAQAPWQLVLGSDVLYERRIVDQMLDLLPRLVHPAGEVWIADPGRATSVEFLERSARDWSRRTTEHNRIEVHRLRLRD